MHKLVYGYVMMVLIAISEIAYASGVPVRGRGEIINVIVDKSRNNDDHLIIDTHAKMMDEILNMTGGPETFSTANEQKVLKETLIAPTTIITGVQNGLEETIAGMGEELASDGQNVVKFTTQLEQDMMYPATTEALQKLSETDFAKLKENREKAIENVATAGLARAWIAEMETSDVAESFAILPDELSNDKMDSQMDAMAQILRLQEETYKNMNTRTALMAEDLKNSGLSALQHNM